MHLLSILLGFLLGVIITICLIGLLSILRSEGIMHPPEYKES